MCLTSMKLVSVSWSYDLWSWYRNCCRGWWLCRPSLSWSNLRFLSFHRCFFRWGFRGCQSSWRYKTRLWGRGVRLSRLWEFLICSLMNWWKYCRSWSLCSLGGNFANINSCGLGFDSSSSSWIRVTDWLNRFRTTVFCWHRWFCRSWEWKRLVWSIWLANRSWLRS